jgi:hypothetical protein
MVLLDHLTQLVLPSRRRILLQIACFRLQGQDLYPVELFTELGYRLDITLDVGEVLLAERVDSIEPVQPTAYDTVHTALLWC